jgi:hypothetical protein
MEIVREAFVLGLHDTFFVGALSCAVAALLALLIRNPKRAPVAATLGATVEQAEATLADGSAYPA